MKYEKESVKQWAEEINNTAKQSTTCSYVIRYGNIDSFDPTDKEAQKDVLEYLWDYHNLDDNLQAIDFDDKNQHIIVMWYEPPRKEEIEEVMEVKKYTIENCEEFCKNALVAPPIEEFEDGSIDEGKWYDTHQIHITVSNHDMRLDYNADNVNEIDMALKEMYEVEMDMRTATTGNTVGGEYRSAELKDIIRVAIQNEFDHFGYKMDSFEKFIQYFITKEWNIEKVMKYYTIILQDVKHYSDWCKCNFNKLDMNSMRGCIDSTTIRNVIDKLICTDKEILCGVTEDEKNSGIVFVMDNTLKPSGDLVGWFYGEIIDEDYINELIADYKNKLVGEV